MILEQLPGYTQAGDVTTVLSYGYWPSYNRPFFPETARLSGIDAEIAKFPNSTYFTYSGYALHTRTHCTDADMREAAAPDTPRPAYTCLFATGTHAPTYSVAT